MTDLNLDMINKLDKVLMQQSVDSGCSWVQAFLYRYGNLSYDEGASGEWNDEQHVRLLSLERWAEATLDLRESS